MLALTENVTEIVKQLTEEVPAMSGVRIAAEPDGQSLSVTPADQAAPTDQVVLHRIIEAAYRSAEEKCEVKL